MSDTTILYGMPHSLYTGKTRSYLRKQGVRYEERVPDALFAERVLPAIGRAIFPVVVLPGGEIVQDTVAILDRLETDGVPLSAYPEGARQRAAACLIELYAVVGLTRHAMHYRWSYRDEQEHFLRDQFSAAGGARAEAVMAKMNGYLPMLGVSPETIPAIEQSYGELLDLLEEHFAHEPYLFGGQPSVGDYGLLGPLFAHLGRDPVPADIMKRRAPKVFRWTERMNAADPDTPEFPGYPAGFLSDDAIPPTVEALLVHIARELVPELDALAEFFRRFAAEGGVEEGAFATEKPHQRTVGSFATSFRNVPITGSAQPYTLWLWQRVTDTWSQADAQGRAAIEDLFARTGLASLLSPHIPLRVGRRDHREVWQRGVIGEGLRGA